ncbi:hypothetical protein [Thauera sp.]
MKQFKHAAVALAMVGMLSAQANASEAQVQNLQAAQPIAAFSQTDIDAMFEQAGQPMQLAALSQQEMRETEGAWVWLYMYAPQITAGAMWAFHAAPRFGSAIDRFRNR